MAPQPPKPGRKGPSSAPLDARVREEQERQDRHRTEELLETCEKLEEELEKLKGRFELYFLGVERREPAREREEMKRRVARLKGEFTRNTGLRFRVETLHARFLSYERMWTRSAREKEEGTYRRDLLKARRRADLERPDQQKVEEAPPGGSATPRQGGGSKRQRYHRAPPQRPLLRLQARRSHVHPPAQPRQGSRNRFRRLRHRLQYPYRLPRGGLPCSSRRA